LLFPTKQSPVSRRLLTCTATNAVRRKCRQVQERLAATSLNRTVTSAISNLITDYRSDLFRYCLLRYSPILPIGVVDVVLVPDERLAQQDIESEIRIILHGIVAKSAGCELVTCHTLDLTSCESVHRIH